MPAFERLTKPPAPGQGANWLPEVTRSKPPGKRWVCGTSYSYRVFVGTFLPGVKLVRSSVNNDSTVTPCQRLNADPLGSWFVVF